MVIGCTEPREEVGDMATMVRVDDQLHGRLRDLAADEERPIGKVIEDAIRMYEKEKFWRGVQEDYARLKADPVAWQDYQDEIALLEGGSKDGLEDEPAYYTPEEEEAIRAEFARTYGR
jgi:hypothetical protein